MRWTTCCLLLSVFLVTAPGSVFCQSYYALDFDGNDHVDVADHMTTNGPFTIEAWVVIRDDSGGGRLVSNRDSSNGLELDVAASQLRLSFNGSVAHTVPMAIKDAWVHVAASWTGADPGRLILTVDGVPDTTSWSGEILPSGGVMRFGGMAAGLGFDLDGKLDEIRIWSAEVSPETIQEWMHKPLDNSHPNYNSLEGYWDFNEGAGQSAGTQVNGPTRDGELGSTPQADDNDPAWVAEAFTPVTHTTFGRLKRLFK